eukprot:5376950-Pleurochrysis_carterae.AAC.1
MSDEKANIATLLANWDELSHAEDEKRCAGNLSTTGTRSMLWSQRKVDVKFCALRAQKKSCPRKYLLQALLSSMTSNVSTVN